MRGGNKRSNIYVPAVLAFIAIAGGILAAVELRNADTAPAAAVAEQSPAAPQQEADLGVDATDSPGPAKTRRSFTPMEESPPTPLKRSEQEGDRKDSEKHREKRREGDKKRSEERDKQLEKMLEREFGEKGGEGWKKNGKRDNE